MPNSCDLPLSGHTLSNPKNVKKPIQPPRQEKKEGDPPVIELYHGTSRTHATAMAGTLPNPGTINVTRGRGEFGRGCHTQDSVGNAFRRGLLLYGHNAAVLVLSIDSHAYHALGFKRLTLNAARKLEAKLTGQGRRHTYTTADDVMVGPLVGQPKIMQQKFQTPRAQALLNGSQTKRTVRP